MNRFLKTIISFMIVLSISSAACLPAFSDDYTSSNYSTTDIFMAGLNNASNFASGTDYWIAGVIGKGIVASVNSGTCSVSSDGLHHSSSSATFGAGYDQKHGDYVYLQCDYCGSMFKCYSDDLSAAYDASVSEMPATGYSSTGGIYWYPTWEDCTSISIADGSYTYSQLASGNVSGFSVASASSMQVYSLISSGKYRSYLALSLYFRVPIDGDYKLLSSVSFVGSIGSSVTSAETYNVSYPSSDYNLY